MRSARIGGIMLAGVLTLTIFPSLPASAGGSQQRYSLPPQDFLGCSDLDIPDLGALDSTNVTNVTHIKCKHPNYRGRERHGPCPPPDANRDPLRNYDKDRQSKIDQLTNEIYRLWAGEAPWTDYPGLGVLKSQVDDLQNRIDTCMEFGTCDLPTLTHLKYEYSEESKRLKGVWARIIWLLRQRNYLQEEKDKTDSDFHKACGCRWFCNPGVWWCPGEPEPKPVPYDPKTTGGQCR